MVADYFPMSIYGAFAGDHSFGTTTKEAGVVCSGGTITLTTGSAHAIAPRVTPSVTSPGFAAAYMVTQFNLGQDSATPGATHAAFRAQGTDVCSVRMDTSGNWLFYVGGVLAYTYTPTGTHHVYLIYGKDGGWAQTVARSWAVSDTVRLVVIIDKVVKYNGTQTATEAATNLQNSALTFGQSTTVSGGSTYTLSAIHHGQTTLTNPIGKLTSAEWTMVANSGSGGDSGGVPYTGYDSSVKSTGTDAKALVDERPPAGSGTTDADEYQLTNNGTNLKQLVALADTLLSAGDVLYAYHINIWDRAVGSAKSNSTYLLMHDGTNVVQDVLAVLAAPTSYAYHARNAGGNTIYTTAPDGAVLTGKTNTYLDTIQVGLEMNTGSTANAVLKCDCMVIEIAKVASGDDITITSRRIFIC